MLLYLSSYETKDEWYASHAQALKALKFTTEDLRHAPKWRPWDGKWIIMGGNGFVPVGEDKWVYIVSHSMHSIGLLQGLRAGVLGNYCVSDATLAIDQAGNLYTNDAHNCIGVELFSDKPVQTMDDFLHTYNSHNLIWRPYLAGKCWVQGASTFRSTRQYPPALRGAE